VPATRPSGHLVANNRPRHQRVRRQLPRLHTESRTAPGATPLICYPGGTLGRRWRRPRSAGWHYLFGTFGRRLQFSRSDHPEQRRFVKSGDQSHEKHFRAPRTAQCSKNGQRAPVCVRRGRPFCQRMGFYPRDVKSIVPKSQRTFRKRAQNHQRRHEMPW